MNRGTLGRIEKIELQRKTAVPPLEVWQEEDGTCLFDGQEWTGIDDIICAYPQYDASNFALCSLELGSLTSHEDALKMLD